MKGVHFAIAMSLLIALTNAVAGQVQQALNRSVNGRPDTDIQIGVYVNVNPDCTSGCHRSSSFRHRSTETSRSSRENGRRRIISSVWPLRCLLCRLLSLAL